MNIDPWILSFSAITVIATIAMGFWSARRSKTASDFFVAGRSVSVGWNASAISGEYLSAASFMGVAGMVMSSGYDALWYPVCYACGYLFLLLFIAGPLRRFGAYTIPDFAEGRYDSPLFRKIAVIFVLFIGFFYTMPQMKGAGTTLAYIFPGLPYWVGVALVGAVITLNVALGGMKGITLVQAFQYWAKMFAISVPIFVLMSVYGHYGKQLGANGKNIEHPTSNIQLSTNVANAALDVGSSKLSVERSSLPANAPEENFLIIEKPREQIVMVGSSNENTVQTVQRKIQEVRANVLPPSGKWSFNQPYSNLISIAEFYSEWTGTKVLVARAIADKKLPFETKTPRTIEGHLAVLDQTLVSNKIFLVRETGNIIRFTPTKAEPLDLNQEAFSARKPLPEKAPADQKWISPFGPLTSKAVKATKPKITYDGPLLINSMSSAIEDFLPRIFNKVSGGKHFAFNAEQAYSFLPTNHSAFNLVLTSTMERQFTRRISEIRYSPQLTNLFISWPSEPRLIKAKDFPKEMHSVLESNGVTVIDDGRVVTAFLTRDAKIIPVNPRPYALLYTYSLIIALVCGTAGLPHILVRFYTNPDGVAAKRTTMWVMILIGIFYVFPPVFGVMGRNLLPDLYNGTGAKGTDKVVLELPRILNERGAHAAGVQSYADRVGLRSSEIKLEERESGAPPALPITKGLPWGSILSGITCAGAFAAFMSTFSGLLVSMTGALAHDVYGRMLRPKSTPEQRMRAFKICAVLIGGVAIVLGCFVEPLEINFMVGQAFAIAAASYFPLLFMSVWWRGMTMRGATIGMLSGGICALVAAALTNFSNLALDKGPMGKIFAVFAPLNDFWAAHPLLRILCEQPAIWTVPLAIGLMVVVSKLTRKDIPPDVQMKMLVLHAPEKLGLKQEYIQEHQAVPH